MKFIRDLISKKRQDAEDSAAAGLDSLEQSYRDTIGSLTDDRALQPPATPRSAGPEPVRNIWDMDPEDDTIALPASVADITPPVVTSSAATRAQGRSRRTKTRLLGFEKSNGDIIDLFSDTPQPATAQRARFPVGWVVVADGPGRGESFVLLAGMSQIGRGEDQSVQLDFGDNAISRNNHAAIVYDPESFTFWLGHGGKSNIVRLNDKPVITNEMIKTGDLIRIGETVLRFVALCDDTFNWANSAVSEDDEDVAIA